ncbi:MAG: SMC family ATPase [Salinibacter sp.]
MVPVRLELKNFLSYGTDAPPLDFDAFEVACLSGGNGEGKSALLDAMTWAVWGEARKSSGKRKPDDELIRIGTRHMEVTFTFDLEGTRYRVTRSFSKSATGKTTSSDLEFQVYAPDDEAYRPLTGATQRETQARIEEAVGLDYDTFINSAFLLQGRSDEFTKKSPSQRKDILVRILNLSRYERLEGRARDRWRAAKERQQRAEAEIERLKAALEDVPAWEDERDELREAIEEQQRSLAELRETETTLTQRRADLEAKAREAESVREALASLDDRIADREEEIAALEERIHDADQRLERSEDIQAAYERYEALQDERDALDEQREVHRGLEKQIEKKEETLRERTNKLERRLDRLQVERNGFEESLNECVSKLAKRPAVQDRLRSAQAARQRVKELAVRKRKQERLIRRQDAAERTLVGRREQLRGELEGLQSQIKEEQEALGQKDALEARVDALEEKKDRRQALDDQLSSLEARGKKLSRRIQALNGQLDARREERSQAQAELERFRQAEGKTCPTCGSELTAAHRQEVNATLSTTIEELEAAIAEREAELEEKKEKREALRERYAERRTEWSGMDGVSEALATAREQRRALDDVVEKLQAHKAEAEALREKLEAGAYGEDARRTWQFCAQRLAGLSVDPKTFEALKEEAAQVERYLDRLRTLEEVEGRREELERKVKQHNQEIQELRDALDDDSTFESIQEELEDLRQKKDDVGFRPERFQEVRSELRELSEAPTRYNELQQARRNRADWVEQRTRLEEQVDTLRREKAEKNKRLDALSEALAAKDDLEEELEDVRDAVQDVEAERNELQQRFGMLNERLNQAERDREALQAAREEREDATHERQVYKRLRTAFGKHGIPSLIMEETLPEIEERANRILDRLTDGRMHVRLDTLKEKKSGGTKETLEIIITDEQGVPRPYETFSGGESFRVNFALRVALAQLLAERSGVRVRTLVIDEGFGTQDEEGIERLVEAIQSIREDFAKVIVITHLERLKQAFPVRIEVEKDPATGSTFDVVGG